MKTISSLLVVLIIVLWITSPMLLEFLYAEQAQRTADLFGPISSLFGGLAFVGVIITILLQRQELIAQRNELKLTRKVHEESVKVMEQSSSLQLRSNLILSFNVLIQQKKNEIEELNTKSNATRNDRIRIDELENQIDQLSSKLENLIETLENRV